jgi:hypothetical protein
VPTSITIGNVASGRMPPASCFQNIQNCIKQLWIYITSNIQRQLANTDRHSVDPQISETQHTRSVGADNDLYVVFAPIVQQTENMSFVVRCNLQTVTSFKICRTTHAAAKPYIKSTWTTIQRAVLLTCDANGRSVDDRCKFLKVAHQQFVKQDLVSIVQRGERFVLLTARLQLVDRDFSTHHLLLNKQTTKLLANQPTASIKQTSKVLTTGGSNPRKLSASRSAIGNAVPYETHNVRVSQ